MKNLEHSIDIAAKPEVVWNILMDFDKYPEWNPMVIALAGDPVVEQRLNASIKVGDRKPMTIKPVVLKVEKDKELRWVGTFGHSFFVRGEHYYRIEETPTGCTFYHGEDFTGTLVGLVMMMMGKDLVKAYELLDEAIKQRAESTSQTTS